MRHLILGAALAAAAFAPAAALAQPPATFVLDGTRLDVVATGEVSRVPDTARCHARATVGRGGRYCTRQA